MALVCLLTVAATPRAEATVFVPISDGRLADRAPLIVEATILAVEPAPGERIATDYLIQVERWLKGTRPADSLIVRVPGGVRPDGVGLQIRGAPRFAEGEEALLFLDPRNDGTYALHQFLLGAFHLSRDADGSHLAWRDLSGARAVYAGGAPAITSGNTPADGVRNLDRFRDWLTDRGQGKARPQDYFLAAASGAPASIPPKFATIVTSTDPPPLGCGETGGHSVRWFDFGLGSEVGWRTHFSGQDGLGVGGIEDFQTALDAWTDDPNTLIRYAYDGLTTAANGFTAADGTNTLLFDDPNGEISGSFDGSGLLAIGGPYFDCQVLQYEGELFHPVLEGDIVTQDGLELFFGATPDPSKAAEQLFGHELGHTLGLAHSQNPEALMLAEYHPDVRGAALDTDDLAGILYLYGPRDLTPPAAPAGLAATLTPEDRVRLDWNDQSETESVFRVERREAGDFALVTTVASDSTTFVDTTVEPTTLYGYRLRAQNGAGASGYTEVVEILTPEDRRPAGPTNLRVAPLSSTAVRLAWQDNSDDETGFVIEIRVGAIWADIPVRLDADTDKLIIEELTPDTTFSFRVRALNGFGDSDTSNRIEITTFVDDPACVATSDQLCLLDGRFQVKVDYRNQHDGGAEGAGIAVPSTNESGLFWFFGPENIELIVKVLDGRHFNDHFWVFYGALSDVEYTITVTDTVTGEVEIYHNPPGEICGVADTAAFPDEMVEIPGLEPQPIISLSVTTSASMPMPVLDVSSLILRSVATKPAAPATTTPAAPATTTPATMATEPGSCVPGPEKLCLLDRRISVSVLWRNANDDGAEGFGRGIGDTDSSGFFWFFNIENTELVIKALDGSALNGHIWIYFGALTDLELWITVEDTVTGNSRVYYNPPGEVCGRGDTLAFPVELPGDPPEDEPEDDPEVIE